MASIATNLFRASTNNENDLEKIEQFLDGKSSVSCPLKPKRFCPLVLK